MTTSFRHGKARPNTTIARPTIRSRPADATIRRQVGSLCILMLLMFSETRDVLAQETQGPNETKGLLPVPDYDLNLSQRRYFAGDFDGGRTKLANLGVQVDVNWTQIGQAIVDGGRDTNKAYGGNVDTLVHFDLMRMGFLPGAMITLRAESRYGETVNAAAGPILAVNTDGFFPITDTFDEGVGVAITNLYYTQFLSDQLALFVGKIDTLDGDPNEFASGRGVRQFMNANFNFNAVTALRMPYSTLAAGMTVLPAKNVAIKASVLNTTDSSTTMGFGDFDDGLTATIEADVQYRLGNLPGGMNFSGLYSFDQDFAQVNGKLIILPGQGLIAPNEDDTWAVYWSAWQYLFVEDPSNTLINVADGRPDHQGVGVFARFGVADKNTNPVEWSASIGVGGRGIIPGRDQDTFGIGYYYSRSQKSLISSVLGIDDEAQGAEAYYNIEITPAAHLTFAIQAVNSPFPDAGSAIILGIRLNVSF